jgi:prepilin-type N-terminal cleavage/methylation domain-containing protein
VENYFPSKFSKQLMKSPRKSSKLDAAFTMVELLVVITIIAVLAALLFSLASRMRNKASSAISVSNLRQIGSAIVTYASDHNSTLPGPVLGDNFPRYQNNAASGQLGWLLKEVLPSDPQPDNPQPRMFYTAALDYPAARSDAKNPKSKNKPTYVVFSKQTDALTRATFWPLGNYNPNSSGEKTPPMTTVQLAGKETRGKPWITEIDQIIRPSTASYGSEKTPPHGQFRNTLMFDYSVKAIQLGEFDPNW